MDLGYSPTEEAFRRELRAWLGRVLSTLPPQPDPEDWLARRAYDTGWQRRLYDAGYAGIDWPRAWGGRGGTPTEQLIFLEETEVAGAPYVGVNFVGLLHAGPTLIAEGTDEQRQRHLGPILRGEEVWCQGFSEPGAGSDLASLRTRAERRGGDYVVNGQKIWTSFAQVADYCELLVRTGGERHRGLTWLICPMDARGIDVRPMRTIQGSSEFSEVFFTDVRIPVTNRVGEENDGWRVAMVTFSFERGTAFVSELLGSMHMLRRLVAICRKRGRADDPGVRRELAHVAAELDALWALTKRNVTQAEREGLPPPGGSVFKLSYAEVRHRLGDLALRLLGPDALVLEGEGAEHIRGWMHAMSLSIAAGTSQIQRNIIGERILGLPR